MWFSAEFRSCCLGLILQMDAAAPTRLCDHCGAVAVSQCVRCKAAFYCRRKCQKFHWSRGGHKLKCAAAAAAFNTPANRERLWQAVYHGHAAAARDLAVRGADVNYRHPVNRGSTPLYVAAAMGHDAIVRALLDAGADKTSAKNDGATPPHRGPNRDGGGARICRRWRRQDLAMAAATPRFHRGRGPRRGGRAAAGADRTSVKNDGATSLFIATQNGHDAVVRALAAAPIRTSRATTASPSVHRGREGATRSCAHCSTPAPIRPREQQRLPLSSRPRTGRRDRARTGKRGADKNRDEEDGFTPPSRLKGTSDRAHAALRRRQ